MVLWEKLKKHYYYIWFPRLSLPLLLSSYLHHETVLLALLPCYTVSSKGVCKITPGRMEGQYVMLLPDDFDILTPRSHDKREWLDLLYYQPYNNHSWRNDEPTSTGVNQQMRMTFSLPSHLRSCYNNQTY